MGIRILVLMRTDPRIPNLRWRSDTVWIRVHWRAPDVVSSEPSRIAIIGGGRAKRRTTRLVSEDVVEILRRSAV